MVTTILLLNLLPCILLTTLNKKIYGVVQQKIKVMRTLNRRKVFISDLDNNNKNLIYSEKRPDCVPSFNFCCDHIFAVSFTETWTEFVWAVSGVARWLPGDKIMSIRKLLPSGKEIKEELDRSNCFRILSIFSNILIVFNSSINFFIYVFKDPKWVLSLYKSFHFLD